MSLADFDEEYAPRQTEKNVVICIYPKSMQETDKSHINHTLEKLEKRLLKEQEENKYLTVQIAYVFGEKIVYARDFAKMEKDVICYVDYESESASLSQMWFMGMILLEKKIAEDRKEGINSQNEVYLLTDREFPRSESGKILATPRFKDIQYSPRLIKSEKSGGGALEKFIAENENGMVELDTDL